MSRKVQRSIGKFLNWKTGAGFLVVLLVIIGVGQLFGIWGPIIRALFGTAGPTGGYSCLPAGPCADGTPQDAKFLSQPGLAMASFTCEPIVVWITSPADWPTFDIGVFDGDSGKDGNGAINPRNGHWDDLVANAESLYTLYADPVRNNNGGRGGGVQVGQWAGNTMPDNAWFNATINNATAGQAALTPDKKNYAYRLEVTRPCSAPGINAFKLRSTAFMSAGQANVVNASFAIVGMLGTPGDIPLIYPSYRSTTNPGQANYNGEWQFYLYVPTDTKSIELWDGDFDRGSYNGASADTDDPNTVGRPAWASQYAVDEGVGGRGTGRGNPADNYSLPLYRSGEPVWYEIVDPTGQPIFQNGNSGNPLEPSGTEEWERYEVTADGVQYPVPNVADAASPTGKLDAGMYRWDIHGLDLHNTVWIRTDLEICPSGECPPPPWCDTECGCPRTIGYWKNNFNKVIGNKGGAQETRESLEWGLRNIALVSPLYRRGIDVCNPVPISDPTPMTLEEASLILQRERQGYPCDNTTMLARALQQNLATWMNFASSKVGYNVTTTLDGIAGGYYEGSMWDALNYAQNIILYQRGDAGLLERAKDIADMINNGVLNMDPEERSCSDATYQQQFPPDKQPPKHQDMPKQPKRDEPPAPPVSCTPLGNNYGIENPASDPFYGIKYEYQSGTEVKDGLVDGFAFTIPTDQATAMTSIQLEAKAGEIVGTATLDGCAFDAPTPCERTVENNGFIFTFQGATDNGNGTVTLLFTIQNNNGFGLSHATFGLPAGVTPPETGAYQSQYCQ